MSVMNYVSSEIKILAVKHCLIGMESLNQSAARFGVSRSTLQKWLLNYEMFGTEGLCHRTRNHHYSKEIKRETVEAYSALDIPLDFCCSSLWNFGSPSSSQIWSLRTRSS